MDVSVMVARMILGLLIGSFIVYANPTDEVPIKIGKSIEDYYNFVGLKNGENIELAGIGKRLYHDIVFNPEFNIGCSSDNEMDWAGILLGEPILFSDKIAPLERASEAIFVRLRGTVYDHTNSTLPDGRKMPSVSGVVIYAHEILEIRAINNMEYRKLVSSYPCAYRSMK